MVPISRRPAATQGFCHMPPQPAAEKSLFFTSQCIFVDLGFQMRTSCKTPGGETVMAGWDREGTTEGPKIKGSTVCSVLCLCSCKPHRVYVSSRPSALTSANSLISRHTRTLQLSATQRPNIHQAVKCKEDGWRQTWRPLFCVSVLLWDSRNEVVDEINVEADVDLILSRNSGKNSLSFHIVNLCGLVCITGNMIVNEEFLSLRFCLSSSCFSLPPSFSIVSQKQMLLKEVFLYSSVNK